MSDRLEQREGDGDKAGRGEEEGGRQGKLGKCLQQNALVRLGKLYQTLATHYTVSFGSRGSFFPILHPNAHNYRAFFSVCRRLLFLSDLGTLSFLSKLNMIMTGMDCSLTLTSERLWFCVLFLIKVEKVRFFRPCETKQS